MTRRAGGSSAGRAVMSMTVPRGDLETLLRRELTAAVSRVEPEADALDRIRARTRRRPPQPWLLSVVSGAVSRARYWVWRGHWAWSASSTARRPQARHGHRSAARPGGKWVTVTNWVTGASWLRPASALAAIAFLAIVTVAVPPLRQAIGHVTAKVLTGGQSSGGARHRRQRLDRPGTAAASSKTGARSARRRASTSATGKPRPAVRRPRPTCHPPGHGRSAVAARADAGPQHSRPPSRRRCPLPRAGCTAASATPTPPASADVRGAHGVRRRPRGVTPQTRRGTADRYTDQHRQRVATGTSDTDTVPPTDSGRHRNAITTRGWPRRLGSGLSTPAHRSPPRRAANLAGMESLMPRWRARRCSWCRPGDLTPGLMTLAGPEGHHAAAVRRLRPGERADVSDGAGTLAECVVTAVGKDSVTLDVRGRAYGPAAAAAAHRRPGAAQGRPRRARRRADDRGRRGRRHPVGRRSAASSAGRATAASARSPSGAPPPARPPSNPAAPGSPRSRPWPSRPTSRSERRTRPARWSSKRTRRRSCRELPLPGRARSCWWWPRRRNQPRRARHARRSGRRSRPGWAQRCCAPRRRARRRPQSC